jgi:hypothetical protein
MHSTVKRLAMLCALGTTLGIAAPVASASAGGTPVAPADLAAFPFPETGFPGFAPEFVPFVPGDAAVSGQVIVGPAVVGPVVHTTAPSSFVNVNNQDSLGGNVAGVQVAGP